MQIYHKIGISFSFLLNPICIHALVSIRIQNQEIIRTACTLVRAPFQKLPLRNDKQTYDYCCKHEKSFIAIVWPIAQGKDKVIEYIFKKYGKICYYKKTRLNFKKAFHILQKAHPHIPDMTEHVDWYFPEGTFAQPARVFVLEFENAEIAVACKLAIRGLYNLQYRSIHINDIHAETVELAEFFFR